MTYDSKYVYDLPIICDPIFRMRRAIYLKFSKTISYVIDDDLRRVKKLRAGATWIMKLERVYTDVKVK